MKWLSFGLGLSQYVPLMVYSLGIIALLATIAYRTEIGLYFLIPLIPMLSILDRIHQFPMGKDLIDLFVVAILLGALLRNQGSVVHDRSLNRAILLLLTVTYLGLWVGSLKLGLDYPLSLENDRLLQWKNFAITPILYFLALYTVKDRRQMVAIIGLMTFTMLMMDRNFYSTFQWVKEWHYSDKQRITGAFTYLGPNELAGFYAQYTMLLISLFLLQKRLVIKGLLAVVVAFNLYCTLYLFSRGAYVAVLAGLVFLGLVADRKILVVLLALFLGWQTLLPVAVVERIEMTQTEEGVDTSVLGRINMWEKAEAIIMSNLIIGVGFGSTPHLGFVSYSGEKARNNIHNGYLEVLLQTGLIGLTCVLFIFYKGIRKGWALYRQSADQFYQGLGLGLAAVTIASLAGNLTGDKWPYLPVMGYFWILMGLVARAHTLSQPPAQSRAANLTTSQIS